MAIYVDGKVLLNTEEQVLKNKEDIESLGKRVPAEGELKQINTRLDGVDVKLGKISTELNTLYDVESVEFTIIPGAWIENETNLVNENFIPTNIIEFGAATDELKDENNALEIATNKIRPLGDAAGGKIKMVCETVPEKTVRVVATVFIPVNFSL